MPQYQQVSGGACSLTLYMEETPGKVAAGTSGVRLAFASEDFKRGSSKKQRSVIRDARGSGKPYAGMANLSGSLESASYAPQLGYIIRALCGAPATTADGSGKALSGAVTDKGDGLVGLPCAGHGFVQDAVVSVTGSTNYDGTYRVAPGVTADEVVIEAPYKAEALSGRPCTGAASACSPERQKRSPTKVEKTPGKKSPFRAPQTTTERTSCKKGRKTGDSSSRKRLPKKPLTAPPLPFPCSTATPSRCRNASRP